MNTPARLLRLTALSLTLARYRLDAILAATHLKRALGWVLWLVPGRCAATMPRGERLRRALVELGPIYVKFGQVLSTRRDLLPTDIADELALLQDQVPPFPGDEARRIVEAELGAPVGELFAAFDPNPLASASIAQVHAAQLKDGRNVVVKVVRPGIERKIDRDLDLLAASAALAERYWDEGERIRPAAIVAEFAQVLHGELDMQREAANASLLRRNLNPGGEIYIPEIYWEYCKDRVLTMERVSGLPLRDLAALRRRGFDLKKLAARGVRLLYTQVFRDNLFHADLHPGNLLVAADHPADPTFIALDFGIVGSLPPRDLTYLGDNFMAMFNREYRRIAELHVEAGWLPADTRIDEMEAAVRTVCEANFSRPLAEISFGELLAKLFQVARRFRLNLQPQLILLQKTLLNVEGLGRQLDPELDIWAVAKPELERILRTRHGLGSTARALGRRLPGLLEHSPEIPELIHGALQQLAAGKVQATLDPATLAALDRQRRASDIRRNSALLAAVLLVLSFLLFAFPPTPAAWLPWLGGGLIVVALFLVRRALRSSAS